MSQPHGHPSHDDGAAAAPAPLDLDEVRSRLAAARGPAFWRSLEELAGDERFRDMVHREFPRQASEWVDDADGVSRRNFLQLASASLALAGLTACTRQPLERIVPYVKQPEDLIPGRPMYFATAVERGGYGAGVLVESHAGRPTKIEGNPEHPWSRGASDLHTQAAILALYDPDRAQTVTQLGKVRSWKALTDALRPVLQAQMASGGAGLRIVTGATTSPTVGEQMSALLATYPSARWHRWEPAGRDAARAGAAAALGAGTEVHYDLSLARTVVLFDSDLLVSGPGAVRYARQFADGRRLRGEGEGARAMSRLYAIESSPTPSGAMADHRVAARPAELHAMALALAAALGVPGAAPVALAADHQRLVEAMARDLRAHPGRSLVAAGDCADAALHTMALAINATLGNIGATVLPTEAVEVAPVDSAASLAELVADLDAGGVELLVLCGVNPVYDAPADLRFAEAIQKARLRVHLGRYADETAQYCQWQVPQAHELEAWGDVRSVDGTISVQQPLIEPLYGGKSTIEFLAALAGNSLASGMDLVRQTWQNRGLGGEDFEAGWRQALHDGVVAGTAAAARAVTVDAAAVAAAAVRLAERAAGTGFTLLLRPDPSLEGGAWANNAWLQELPKPLTKLTWDNALWLAPKTAQAMGVEHEEVARIEAGGAAVEVAVWIMPGQAEDCGTLHLGFGRTHAGRVGNGVGVSAYPLRTARAPWSVAGVRVTGTGRRYPLASTQMHSNIPLDGEEAFRRHLVRVGTLADYVENPDLFREMAHERSDLTLYPGFSYTGYAWGLAVDLNACTGCNACVVACQSENNIPSVGKEQVARGREMHWIRIDRYYRGDLDRPEVYSQPVMCMQCEQAPCETVCPVAATVHSAEGLNDMVYNRCVGTRYCSNNCPYKVRRFNFMHWNGNDYNSSSKHPVLELLRNPNVTVRSRGVMEKCTYCVQRINRARIESEKQDRKLRDGEIKTACQQACPSQAIVFGDINDKESQVSRWKADPRNYGLLEELNTRPRTTYLARVRNPNPELEAAV